MSQRRVHFDLPKHIYAAENKDGATTYFFRITRRPTAWTGKQHFTIQSACKDLQDFLATNPDKRPRYDGDSPHERRHYQQWRAEKARRLRKLRGKNEA